MSDLEDIYPWFDYSPETDAQPNRPALTVEERIDEILSSFYFDSCDEAMETGVEHALSTDKWPSKDKAKQRLKRLVLEGRIRERKQIALDNYHGHTFSDSTNWQGKFQKFIDNNEKRLAALTAELGELGK